MRQPSHHATSTARATLATLRSARDHLQAILPAATSHVRKAFGLPKLDAIADTAGGFNGN